MTWTRVEGPQGELEEAHQQAVELEPEDPKRKGHPLLIAEDTLPNVVKGHHLFKPDSLLNNPVKLLAVEQGRHKKPSIASADLVPEPPPLSTGRPSLQALTWY
jgi:hypothetical protein